GGGLVDGVAAFHRQVSEHRAGGDALQPVDADVGNREGRDRRSGGRLLGEADQGRGGGQRRGQGNGKQAAGKVSRHHHVRFGLTGRRRGRAGHRGRSGVWQGVGGRNDISAPGC